MNELVKATFAKAYGEIEQYSDCQWKIIFKKLVDHNLADDEHQQEIDGEQQQEVDEQQQQQVNDDDESQHGEQQQQEVDDGQKQHDKLKLRIIRLAEEICSFDQYRTLIEVLLFDCSFKELAKSMVDVFCILKYEVDIIEAVNYEEMLFALNSKKFFTKYDKQWLNISNNSNIFEVLYTKEIHDFPIFFKCLSSVKDSKTIVLKIKKEKENLLAPISSALGTYQQYLIQRYTSPSFMAIDNIFSTPHCHFIDPLLKEINKHEQHSSLEHCLLFKQTYSKSISLSNIFCDNEHRVILLQGSPGSGKTTLSKHLCSKWVIGELLQQYSHVIFVELRDTRIASNVTSVKEFIALHRGEHANSIATEIYTKNGKDTMFILEGWDELRVSDTELSYNFLTDLIRGMCLPDAHIIITSRPCGLKTLRLQFVSHMIEILGFSNEQVEQYVQCYFQEGCDSTAEARFWNLLQSHPHFKNMLIVPVTLCIFLYVFENTNNQIPQTLTRIYEHLIKFVLCRNQSRTQQVNSIVETLDDLPNDILSVLNKLGELAFYGLLIDKLTFSKKEISKYCWNSEEIPRNFDGMGILQEKTNVYCNFVSSIYQFLHRTVQEFLAARYLSQQTKSLQQDALKELFGNNDMEMVWIFYGGLTGFKSIVVKDFLPNSVSRKLGTAVHNVSVHAWEIIGHTLFKFSSLKSMIKAYFTKQGYSRYICSSILSREFLCTLLVAALEAQNPKFCAALCTSYLFNGNICWITVPESVVTPQILLGLSYFIAHSGKKCIIQCKTLDDVGADSLLKYLTCTESECDQVTCRTDNRVWALDIHSSSSQINGLVKIIRCQTSLEWLILSQSISFDDECITKLCEALKTNETITMLHLLSCNINRVGIEALAGLLKLNSTLQWIGLRDNPKITEQDVVFLLNTIDCYRNKTALYMLIIDDHLADKPEVKKHLGILNANRRRLEKKELSVLLLECIRCSKICCPFLHI